MKKTLVLLLLFVFVQIVSTSVALLLANVSNLANGGALDEALLLNHPQYAIYALFVGYILLFMVLYYFKLCRREAFVRRIKLSRREIALGLLGFFLLIGGSSFLSELLQLSDGGSTQMFSAVKGNFIALLLLCVVGPVMEEVIFREGILRSLLESHMNPMWALFISAALFAVVHGNLAQMLPALILGVVLGLFYLRTGNVWFCSLAHVLNNTAGIISLYSMDATDLATPTSPYVLIAGVAAMYLLGVVVLKRWWAMRHL